jgi:hypothetical protein
MRSPHLQLPFRSGADVRKFETDMLLNANDGWQETRICVQPAELPGLRDPFEVTFHHRDILTTAGATFSDPELGGRLALRPREKYVDSDLGSVRVYDEVHRGDAWLKLQKVIRGVVKTRDPAWKDRAVVAGLQLSSDKTHLTVKGDHCHPVRCTLLNVTESRRDDHRHVLAYFPVLDKGIDRHLKLTVLHKCLRVLLEPLVGPGKRGVRWKSPQGIEYLVFPRVMSYVGDDPEIRDLLCIKSHQGKLPCESCTASQDQLATTSNFAAEARDAGGTLATILAASKLRQTTGVHKGTVDAFCSQHSIVAVEPAFSILPSVSMSSGGDGDYHSWFGYDSLHNDDLGLIPELVTAVCNFIKAKHPKKFNALYKHMNGLLQQLPRSEDFRVPGNGYFPDFPHAQAKEHRNVLQVLPQLFSSLREWFKGEALRAEFRQVLQVLVRSVCLPCLNLLLLL